MHDLDPDTKEDLKIQLEHNRDKIKEKYASFVVSLCEAVKVTGVSLDQFRLYLLGLSAFESKNEREQPILLDDVKALINAADSIYKIFGILTTDCCSFINVGIFQSIISNYDININSQASLQYTNHLKAYLENHTIEEFISINPNLKNYPKNSEILTLKFDTTLPSKITKVVNLKSAIAKILGVKSHALRLVGIEEGCVVVTFFLPRTVAAYVFDNGLSAKQEAEIKALPVMWLKCRGFKLGGISHQLDVRFATAMFDANKGSIQNSGVYHYMIRVVPKEITTPYWEIVYCIVPITYYFDSIRFFSNTIEKQYSRADFEINKVKLFKFNKDGSYIELNFKREIDSGWQFSLLSKSMVNT